jgi:large subunit ribosomal protein L13
MNTGTHSATRGEALKGRKWWVVDVADVPVGRAATQVATILKGKHKPNYTPSLDVGDSSW